MMLNKNSEIDALKKQPEFSQKLFFRKKKRKSAVGVVLRIILIYFPLGVTLTAIALPFFIGCGVTNKVKQLEAKQYVSSMNHAQQAELGKNGKFANSVDELELGIKTQTSNFRYSVSATETAAFSYGIPHPSEYTVYFGPFHWNQSKKLNGYVGAVFIVPSTNTDPKETDDITTVAIICVTKSPTQIQPPNPIFEKGLPTCGDRTEPVF